MTKGAVHSFTINGVPLGPSDNFLFGTSDWKSDKVTFRLKVADGFEEQLEKLIKHARHEFWQDVLWVSWKEWSSVPKI
jgi:hypothetical protein